MRNKILLSGGLINLGNTCYLNSQIECLYHLPYVRNVILSASPSSRPSIAYKSLQHVFHSMEEASLHGDGNLAITPAATTAPLCRALGIQVYEQQDSQEFWKLLLPELESTTITELYRGQYETYIAALDGSKRERKRVEPFLDLSLDVTNFGTVNESIEDMFSSGEVLSVKEGNGWRPEKGAEKVDALKGNAMQVGGLPKILQLHLMRFNFDWQTETMNKINERFKFPKELDLSQICTDSTKDNAGDAVYDLHAIVVHAGQFGSGHYYAYVRPDIRKNEWYRYDDDRVTQVKYKDVREDAFGGQSSRKINDTRKIGLLRRLLHSGQEKRFGWGGKHSSAYMLQYIKRVDIPLIFNNGSKA